MTTHLRAVDNHEPPPIANSGRLPAFEGSAPDFARIKLTSVSDLEAGEDEAHHLDDVVRMFVEGRVVRVDHVVDDKSGKLKRVHTIKVVEAILLPWDFDTGAFDG